MAATSLTKRRRDAPSGGKKKAKAKAKARRPDKHRDKREDARHAKRAEKRARKRLEPGERNRPKKRKDAPQKHDTTRDEVTTLPAVVPPIPGVQYIASLDDIPDIAFLDGMAAVEVPIEIVRRIPFKNDHRERSPRLIRIEKSIRNRGYDNTLPIIARIGQKGRWVIVDGGHRLTAAKTVAGEFWSNLLSKKVRTLYFLLFTTPRSWAKVKRIAEVTLPHAPPPKTLLPDHPGDINEDEATRFGSVTRRERDRV